MTRALFSTFDVTRQVFYRSARSLAIVNLKPLVPGHVLVIPHRVCPRLTDLTPPELADLFLSVQAVGRAVERAFDGAALTVAVQDGAAAGQSVPHVHVHVIPRRAGDWASKDDVYPAIEGAEGALAADLGAREAKRAGKWDVPSDDERRPRGEQEMADEAAWLSTFLESAQDTLEQEA